MTDRYDAIAKALASDMPRRKVLKLIAGGITASFAAAVGRPALSAGAESEDDGDGSLVSVNTTNPCVNYHVNYSVNYCVNVPPPDVNIPPPDVNIPPPVVNTPRPPVVGGPPAVNINPIAVNKVPPHVSLPKLFDEHPAKGLPFVNTVFSGRGPR